MSPPPLITFPRGNLSLERRSRAVTTTRARVEDGKKRARRSRASVSSRSSSRARGRVRRAAPSSGGLALRAVCPNTNHTTTNSRYITKMFNMVEYALYDRKVHLIVNRVHTWRRADCYLASSRLARRQSDARDDRVDDRSHFDPTDVPARERRGRRACEPSESCFVGNVFWNRNNRARRHGRWRRRILGWME